MILQDISLNNKHKSNFFSPSLFLFSINTSAWNSADDIQVLKLTLFVRTLFSHILCQISLLNNHLTWWLKVNKCVDLRCQYKYSMTSCSSTHVAAVIKSCVSLIMIYVDSSLLKHWHEIIYTIKETLDCTKFYN